MPQNPIEALDSGETPAGGSGDTRTLHSEDHWYHRPSSSEATDWQHHHRLSQEGTTTGDSGDPYGQLIFSAYLQGQLTNVAKAALWWSTYGVVAEALTGFTLSIGITRLVFNLALILLSPVAGAVAEKKNIQTLLVITTLGRLCIWCIFIPLLWFLSKNTFHAALFNVGFIFFMFCDGAQVSFSNVVDIDCGGLDTLASQFGLTVANSLRDRFNRIHQIVFDASFIVLTPPCAFLIWQVAIWMKTSCRMPLLNTFSTKLNINKACGYHDVAILIGGISIIFGCLSLFSLWNYKKLKTLPSSVTSTRGSPIDGTSTTEFRSQQDDDDDATESTAETEFNRSYWSIMHDNFIDVKEGLMIVMNEKSIRWRLIFLALETALEDSVVSVIIPQIALRLSPLLLQEWSDLSLENSNIFSATHSIPGGWAFVNFVAVCGIAAGKIGGLLAAAYMSLHWVMPNSLCVKKAYIPLFRCMFVSGISLMLLPITYSVLKQPGFLIRTLQLVFTPKTTSYIIILVSDFCIILAFFIFFVFSAIPKIGFATLLHSLVLQRDVGAKVFGFVGTCVTLVDAIVITVINGVFAKFGADQFPTALWIVALIYAVYGFCELFLAPRLILYSEAEVNEAVDFSTLASCYREDVVGLDTSPENPYVNEEWSNELLAYKKSARKIYDGQEQEEQQLYALNPLMPR